MNSVKICTNTLFRKIVLQYKISVRCYNGPRRALMYVPGDDLKKINKSFTLDVDCIALDCEDGVAINKKKAARDTIRTILENEKPKKAREYDLGVRINALDTVYWKEDLISCLSSKYLPDTILLPKVESAETIKLFSGELNKNIHGDKKVNLIIYIETARAFVNLVNICETAKTLSNTGKFTPASLVFGSDDFCASLGITRTEECMEILYARQKLVLVAKAFNLQAIDMVYIKYKDLEGLKAQCIQGKHLGYTGKQVIHPGQVPVVQEAFFPTKAQIEWASDLLDAFHKHQSEGKGAFTYKGSMIDMPTVKQAKNILQLANLGKITYF